MTKKQIDVLKDKRVNKIFETYMARAFPKSNVKKSSFKEDAEKLIDYYINDKPVQLKIKRCESRDDKNNIWVEFMNINGKPGWILGDSELLMEFHYSLTNTTELADVYCCDMKDLAKLAIPFTMGKRLVDMKPSEAYVPYRRGVWGNRDMIARVPIEDMQTLPSFKHWKADEQFTRERREIEEEVKKLKEENNA